MPHQCVKCSKVYPDGTKDILKGCPSCGGLFFFFIKQENLEQIKEEVTNLSEEDKEQIEKDVMEIIGEDIDKDMPVILDLESIRILKPGKFEIDIRHLFNKEPLIYKMEDGKYVIDVVTSFHSRKK